MLVYIYNVIGNTDVFGHITDKRTPSRPLGEVKLRRAGPVVRWVTTREAPVLKAHFLFYSAEVIFLLVAFTHIMWLWVITVVVQYRVITTLMHMHMHMHEAITVHNITLTTGGMKLL